MAPRRRRVVWTAGAERDLDEILAWLATHSRTAAERLLVEVLEAAGSLEALTRRARVVPELGRPEVRELFVRRYRLLYEIHTDRVTILALIHGARDFPGSPAV